MGDNGDLKEAGNGSLDAAQTQPEIDFENHQLGTTVKLSDGTEGRIFSRGARNKDGHLTYTCHLCMVVNLPGERVMLTHIAGRKHQNRLSHPVIDADTFRKISAPKTNKIQMHIAPGEPVPPGMENEVKPVAELQATIDRFREGPMVGLEYVMELTSPSLREPSYHCVLCDKKGDPRTIIVHITSYIHRSKFLEKHYPTAINELAQWRGQKGCKDVIARVIQTVCEAIEDHHGRMTPNVHEVSDYNRNKTKYLQEVLFEKHFDERTGPKFVEVIDKKALQEQLLGPGEAPIVGERVVRDPSPPVVPAPIGQRKSKPARADRKSLDSISSIDSVQSISSSESKGNRPPGDNRIRPLAKTFDDRNPVRVEQARLTNRRRSPLPFRRQSPPFRRVGASPVRNTRFNRRSRSPPPRRRSRSPLRRRSPVGRHDRSPLRFNDRKSQSPSKDKQRSTLPTPKQLALQASEIAHERYKWEKYRCSLEIATAQIDKIFKEHEKNPEKHPLYPEEWKMFWNRRYKELQNEKKDPSKHDFKPEWIQFWTKRMKELRDEEVEKKKIEIRTKLNLPSEDSEKTDALKEQYTVKVTKKKKERSVEPIESDEDEVVRQKPARAVRRSRSPISDEERSRHSRREHRSPKPASRPRRSRSPISDEDRGSRRRDFNSRDRERDRPGSFHRGAGFGEQHDYDEWAKTYYGNNKKVFVREEFDNYNSGTLSFVAVCRLLTALEEYLGSLGPRVIDLLAKALALEKVKANSADELLLNEDNSMFLETVKEKLKGCLMAELLEPQMIAPVKKAIRNIASLLHEASKKEKPAEPVVDDPLPISGPPHTPGGVDKAAIAQKLAAALVAQGKTDFTSAELEELINVYVAMAEASKDKEKPVTTSTFLNDVAGPSKQAPPPSAGPSRRRVEEPADNTEANALEGLTDSDLQTLLQNFKDLSNEEQLHLISHLKKLEKTDPVRVEKLRRYVNLDDKPQSRRNDDYYPEDDDQYNDNDIPDFDNDDDVGRFEDNANNFNPRRNLNQPTQIKSLVSGSYEDDEHDPSAYAKPAFVDSEEEDYSYDDVVRAASKNVVPPPQHSNSNSLQGPPPQAGRIRVADFGIDQHDSNSNFSQRNQPSDPTLDAANIVANLMGTLAAKNSSDAARQSYSAPNPTSNNPASTYQSIYAGLGPNGKPLSATNNFMTQQRPQFAPIQTANTSLNSMPFYYQQQMRAQQQMQQQTQQQQQQGSYGGYGAGQPQQQPQQQNPAGGGQYQGYGGNNYY
uniref:Uncharacterized protein CG7065 n=4 Tax=Culex pipiens TaxID=7175 RepID=A0A8D8H6U8_CULPI